jgi:hypothetical protein
MSFSFEMKIRERGNVKTFKRANAETALLPDFVIVTT